MSSMSPTIVATATTSATATSSAAPTPTATSTPASGKVDHSLICRNSYILYRFGYFTLSQYHDVDIQYDFFMML